MRKVVDVGAAADDQRDQLGVEPGQPFADALVRRLDDRCQPFAERGRRDAVVLPHGEIEDDLQLLGRRRLQDSAGVAQPQLVHHVVELVAR